MIHKTAVVGPLQCNCILLGCERTREAVLIDPGDEPAKILKMIQDEGLQVKYLLHTHAHFDHVGATGKVSEALGALPCLHRDDQPLYDNLPLQGQMFGFKFEQGPAIAKHFEHEEEIVFGDHSLKVIHTPGHSPGSVCFSLSGTEFPHLYSGDTLFHLSVGRADLWGGDPRALVHSIRDRLLTLDDETRVYPGHGSDTQIGIERRANPFLT